MRAAQLYRYQVPMDAGVVLRERRLKTRDGLLVRLSDNGREGWGDIAPLPGFSDETLTRRCLPRATGSVPGSVATHSRCRRWQASRLV